MPGTVIYRVSENAMNEISKNCFRADSKGELITTDSKKTGTFKVNSLVSNFLGKNGVKVTEDVVTFFKSNFDIIDLNENYFGWISVSSDAKPVDNNPLFILVTNQEAKKIRESIEYKNYINEINEKRSVRNPKMKTPSIENIKSNLSQLKSQIKLPKTVEPNNVLKKLKTID